MHPAWKGLPLSEVEELPSDRIRWKGTSEMASDNMEMYSIAVADFRLFDQPLPALRLQPSLFLYRPQVNSGYCWPDKQQNQLIRACSQTGWRSRLYSKKDQILGKEVFPQSERWVLPVHQKQYPYF